MGAGPDQVRGKLFPASALTGTRGAGMTLQSAHGHELHPDVAHGRSGVGLVDQMCLSDTPVRDHRASELRTDPVVRHLEHSGHLLSWLRGGFRIQAGAPDR